MSRLQEEKERRLLELETLWRTRVQQEELLKLKQAQVGEMGSNISWGL